MREFLYMALIEPFDRENDWGSFIIGILIWILFLAIICGMLWFFTWIYDSSFLPIQKNDGVIVNKYITPSYVSTTYVQSGNVFIPITTFHDETYNVVIKVGELTDGMGINSYSYSLIDVGQNVECEYTNGRILNSLYIKSFNIK